MGRKFHFPSPAPTSKIRIRKPFTRSSSHKEVVEAKVLPKASFPRKDKYNGKGIEKTIEVIDKASFQHKDKVKATEKSIEVINIIPRPSNPTFKRLIRQLRGASEKRDPRGMKEYFECSRRIVREM
jgi:hypothetical protein